jgi:hypothetical protein
MKKMFLAIVGVALVVAINLLIKTNQNGHYVLFEQNYHYVLLQQNGELIRGTKPLKFEDLEWWDVTGHQQVFIPLLDGLPVLCKVGDEKGPMYTYHPFSASNKRDFKHNPTTISGAEIATYFEGFEKPSKEISLYQAVVKIRREFGGVDSIERGLIEGSLHL